MRRFTKREALEFIEGYNIAPEVVMPAAVVATIAGIDAITVRDDLEIFAAQSGFEVDPRGYEVIPDHLDDAETLDCVNITIRTE